MERRIIAVAVALAFAAASSFAQDSGEPSGQSVLEKARERFAGQGGGDGPAAGESGEGAVGFAPFQLAFTPGLAFPFGYHDVGFSAGAVGSLVRHVRGAQFTGVFGLAGGDVEGFQGAGVFNIAAGDVRGFQGSGVFNLSGGDIDGFQGAGVFNIAEGRVSGFQGAGVFNIADSAAAPVQAAGVFNIVEGRLDGFQFAGVFNVAGDVNGGQFAPVFNVADRVRGVQVGLVNVAERLDGIQIGLVNIARDGLHGAGLLWRPDQGTVEAFWQNGSPFMYTVIRASMPEEDWLASSDRLVLSAGLGSRLRLGRPYIDADLSASLDLGPSLDPAGAAIAAGDWEGFADALPARAWPSARLLLGLPVLGRLHAIVGLSWDLDLADAPGMPERLKTGDKASAEWFGLPFDAYRSWYVGFRL